MEIDSFKNNTTIKDNKTKNIIFSFIKIILLWCPIIYYVYISSSGNYPGFLFNYKGRVVEDITMNTYIKEGKYFENTYKFKYIPKQLDKHKDKLGFDIDENKIIYNGSLSVNIEPSSKEKFYIKQLTENKKYYEDAAGIMTLFMVILTFYFLTALAYTGEIFNKMWRSIINS